MTTSKRLLAVVLAAVAVSTGADGQTAVTNSYMIGAGATAILDTYLSQEKFSGTGLTIMGTSERRKQGQQWTTLWEHELNFATTDDRSTTVSELQGDYTLLAGRLRTWQLPKLTLKAGFMGALNLGFIYNTSNSNNPAQGRLSLNIMPAIGGSYEFPLFGKTWTANYELQLPLLGLMFSPNYGQSYYEIFSRGNYDHNVVPTTFIAAPNFRQLITVGCRLSRRFTLRIGYLGNYQQANVNNLKSHIYSHRLMIGFVRSFTITHRP